MRAVRAHWNCVRKCSMHTQGWAYVVVLDSFFLDTLLSDQVTRAEEQS